MIGALPPQHWQQHIDTVVDRLDSSSTDLYLAVIDAGTAWTDDPHGQARRRLANLTDQPPRAVRAPGQPPPSAASTTARWAPLAESISPTLTDDPEWPGLERTLQLARDVGRDLTADLLTLASDQPGTQAAHDLHERLLNAAGDTAPTRSHAAHDRGQPPTNQAARRQLPHDPPSDTTAEATSHKRAQSPPNPQQQWADLAAHIDPRLAHDDGWTALAHTLSRAAAAGIDVTAELPHLATNPPLPERHLARELQYRLIAYADLDPDPAGTAIAVEYRTTPPPRQAPRPPTITPRPPQPPSR